MNGHIDALTEGYIDDFTWPSTTDMLYHREFLEEIKDSCMSYCFSGVNPLGHSCIVVAEFDSVRHESDTFALVT